MDESTKSREALQNFHLEIRVRYHEVDGQCRVHHGQYLNYFERGRVEMLRAAGISYKQMEAQGWMLVVRRVELTYHLPAEFDDLLILRVVTTKARGARIFHQYEIYRGEQLLVNGESEIACLRQDGKVARLPPELQLPL